MPEPSAAVTTAETTALLLAAGRGDAAARERLFSAVYDELRRIAGGMLGGAAGGARAAPTLQPTALVHEAWLRLADQTRIGGEDRTHFLRIAARAMRFVLVDHWRAQRAQKRGGAGVRVTLVDDEHASAGGDPHAWLAVHEALEQLAAVDEQLVRIAELRLFAGQAHEEVAACLGISLRSAERGWRSARAFLVRALGDESR